MMRNEGMRSTPHTSASVARQLGACTSAAFSTLHMWGVHAQTVDVLLLC